ncbi:MAG TPA: hypothetical protein VGM39_05830 [Kofleriaceae bacterium]|jgi:hypothetical protein
MAEIEGNAPGERVDACEPFDVKNPACRDDPRMCLVVGSGMDCKCPSPPDVALPACRAVMPCPDPPDRRVRTCKRSFPPQPPGLQPMIGRVIAETEQGTDLVSTIGIGEDQGLTTTWRPVLLSGESDQPLAGGEIHVVRVNRHVTLGTVHVAKQVLEANTRVRFDPP